MFELVNVFDFTNKFDKRKKKLELNLNIEFGIAVLSATSTSRGNMELLKQSMRDKVGQKSSHPVQLSRPG